MNAHDAGRWRRRLGFAVLFAVLHLRAAAGQPATVGAGASILSEPRVPPALPARGTEALDDTLAAERDSIRSALVSQVRAAALLLPPESPCPRLIAWLGQILAYPDSGFVRGFARTAEPERWGPADPTGALALHAALALMEENLPAAAARWIESGGVAERDRPYARVLGVEALAASGDSAGAMAAATALLDGGVSRSLAADALGMLIDDREAKLDGQGLLTLSHRIRRAFGPCAEELAARYRAHRLLSQPGAMRGVGDTLIASYPGTRTARVEALRRFREAPAHAASTMGRPLLDVLLRHGQFGAADSLIRLLRDADSSRVVFLESLYSARRYADILEFDIKVTPRWTVDLQARYHLVRARAARNVGRSSLMVRHYEAAVLLGGETRRTALVEWGRETESDREEAQADSVYSRLLLIAGSEDEARLRRGLSRMARGLHREAAADFEAIGTGDFAAAGAFWISRALGALGDSAGAAAALRRASAGSGYHAHRARRQIALGLAQEEFWAAEASRIFAWSAAGWPPASQGAGIDCGEPPRTCLADAAWRLRLFRRFGRVKWAANEQERLDACLPQSGAAESLYCLGLPDLSVRAAIRGGDGRRLLRYPVPFYGDIVQEAAQRAISPSLVYAIARRESLFDPGAVSGAGARGLLQMMRATAEETGARWGIAAAPLERYDVNLRLGIRHLRDLRDQHAEWHVPAILAAYNAGATKTAEWVERFGDIDLFIERIGWRETRDYVRHVLDAYWTYEEQFGPLSGGSRP